MHNSFNRDPGSAEVQIMLALLWKTVIRISNNGPSWKLGVFYLLFGWSSLAHLLCFLIFGSVDIWITCNKVGSLSPALRVVGFEPGAFQFKNLNLLGHSLFEHLLLVNDSTNTIHRHHHHHYHDKTLQSHFLIRTFFCSYLSLLQPILLEGAIW